MAEVFYSIPAHIRKRIEHDLKTKRTASGYRFNLDNDWDLHLYTRLLKQSGKSKDEARQILLAFPLVGIPKRKRESYVEDVLDSIVVGYAVPKKGLPVYIQVGGE